MQKTMLQAAATSMMIWMQMFILGMAMASATVRPSETWSIWQKAKPTMMSREPRKTNTEALPSLEMTLSRVVAELPYM